MNIKQVRENYPKNSFFISATGMVKVPLMVTHLRYSEVRHGDIVEENGGVIYCAETNKWAEKCTKNF